MAREHVQRKMMELIHKVRSGRIQRMRKPPEPKQEQPEDQPPAEEVAALEAMLTQE